MAGVGVAGWYNNASGISAGLNVNGNQNNANGYEAGRTSTQPDRSGTSGGSDIGTLATRKQHDLDRLEHQGERRERHAIGTGSTAAHVNSAAFGFGAATTVADQIMLGSGSTQV